MSDIELIETDEHWTVSTENSQVTRVSFDWAVSLLIGSDKSSFEIRVQDELRLEAPDSSVVAIDPEGDIDQLAGALVLLRQPVAYLHALKNGDLEIGLADGRAVFVGASEEYEPWELTASGGTRVVSTPGGGISVWRG